MTTKYYYSFNTEEKTFSGKFPASKNPRRQSEYLLPAKATFIEPLKQKKMKLPSGTVNLGMLNRITEESCRLILKQKK